MEHSKTSRCTTGHYWQNSSKPSSLEACVILLGTFPPSNLRMRRRQRRSKTFLPRTAYTTTPPSRGSRSLDCTSCTAMLTIDTNRMDSPSTRCFRQKKPCPRGKRHTSVAPWSRRLQTLPLCICSRSRTAPVNRGNLALWYTCHQYSFHRATMKRQPKCRKMAPLRMHIA